MPRQSILRKLADYFEISVEMLLNATPALWNAARESVANQDFAKLPIEQREAMLKAAKEIAPTPKGESDNEKLLIDLFRQLSPERQQEELAYLAQAAKRGAVQDM